MDKHEGMTKGEHEKAMAKAKEMMDRGCGMSEMEYKTQLSEEDILKAKRKWIDQS